MIYVALYLTEVFLGLVVALVLLFRYPVPDVGDPEFWLKGARFERSALRSISVVFGLILSAALLMLYDVWQKALFGGGAR